MKKIVLFTEEPLLAHGLQAVLAATDLAVDAVCDTSADLLRYTGQPVDLFLVEATSAITLDVIGHLTAPPTRTPVALWIGSMSYEFASQAIMVGARALIRKTLPTPIFLQAIEEVLAGGLWIEKDLSDRLLLGRPVPLTGRERQLVALLAQGLKNKEIAWTLGITEGTVKVYMSRLFNKVGANDRFELALYALRNLCSNAAGEFEVPSPVLDGASDSRSVEQFPVPKLTCLGPIHRGPRPTV